MLDRYLRCSLLLFVGLLAFKTERCAAMPPTTQPDAEAVRALAERYTDRLERSHYLARGPSRPAQVDGWQDFALRRYTYRVTDKDGTMKTADVVLLLPSAEQIARWIVEAVVEVRGNYDETLARKTFDDIIGQSGGQFPVAGVVYEDILPADGVNEVYCFRDGVTVAVEGLKHRKTEPLTPAEIEASINGPITRVYQYARIASTSPQQFIDAGGSRDVLGVDGKPTRQWPVEIRKAFQAAWGKDRNALIVAWVRSNASTPSAK